ncbi:MAG: hypothetical protein ACRC7G_15055, partial [Beijerinckiaceae bacterium]
AALMSPVMARLQLVGGSHAQRDVFAQIQLEAMTRLGGGEAVGALALRRRARGGHNRFASQRLERMLGSSRSGDVALEALHLAPARRFH